MKIMIATFLCTLLAPLTISIAANNEPDESGLGGTGRSISPSGSDVIFSRPELPERLELPDTPTLVQPASPEILQFGDPPVTISPTPPE